MINIYHQVRKNVNILCLSAIVGLTGCAGGLEGYNRKAHDFNMTVDKYTLKPAAKAYKAITPDPVERSVSNFFSNIGEVNTTINSLLQAKFHNAAVSSSRVVWNTIIGLGGIFDVATPMGLKSNPEDFGQTLRYWGVPAGPFVVVPLLGPTTVTDAAGRLGDYFVSPYSRYTLENHYARASLTTMRALSSRAKYLSLSDMLENSKTDGYALMRDAYLKRRESLTRDGKQDVKNDEAFDDLFFDEVLGD